MLEIQRIKEKIKNLDEAETKSLLMMIYIGLDTAINVKIFFPYLYRQYKVVNITGNLNSG